MKTLIPSINDITRKWYLFDAKGKILGRLSTEIADLLMGKNKTNFVRNFDMGDHVVVINASSIAVTGNKVKDKLYHRHSGYPGGMKVTTMEQMMAKSPEQVIIKAVAGMLPKNKLHDKMLKHLHVYPTAEHPYSKQFPQS